MHPSQWRMSTASKHIMTRDLQNNSKEDLKLRALEGFFQVCENQPMDTIVPLSKVLSLHLKLHTSLLGQKTVCED